MSITRRDFLNGVALTVVAGLTPWDLARAEENGIAEKAGEYYWDCAEITPVHLRWRMPSGVSTKNSTSIP